MSSSSDAPALKPKPYYINSYIALSVLLIATLVGFSAFYFKRRHKFPIKGRPHALIFATIYSFAAMALDWGFTHIADYKTMNCYLVLMVLVDGFVGLTVAMTLRLFLMWTDAQLTQKKVSLAAQWNENAEQAKADLLSLKVRRRWLPYGTFVALIVSFCISTGIFAAKTPNSGFGLRFYGDDYSNNKECMDALTAILLNFFVPVLVLLIGSSTWLVLKLRQFQDNFYIKQEIFLTTAMVFLTLVYIFLIQIPPVSDQLFNQGYDYGTLFFLYFPTFFLIAYSLGINVWRTYCEEFSSGKARLRDSTQLSTAQSTQSKNLPRSLDDLKKIFLRVLNDDIGFDLFQKFLQREWSVENILFWRSAVDFRESFNSNSGSVSEETIAKARRISEQYISESALMSVNLPSDIRKETMTKVQSNEIKADTFEAAEKEIFLLMLKDSFRRFMYRDDTGFSSIQEKINNQQSVRKSSLPVVEIASFPTMSNNESV